jgi:hypothetical protein
MGYGAAIAAGAALIAAGISAGVSAEASAQQSIDLKTARDIEVGKHNDDLIAASDKDYLTAKEQFNTMSYQITKDGDNLKLQLRTWLQGQSDSMGAKMEVAMADAKVRLAQIEGDSAVEAKQINLQAKQKQMPVSVPY